MNIFFELFRLRRKYNRRKREQVYELKGIGTKLSVKRYFFNLIKEEKFMLYSVTLNKVRVYDYLRHDKDRIYNWVSGMVIKQIPFEAVKTRLQIVVDKSKKPKEKLEFNNYIIRYIKSKIDPKIPISIDHLLSHEEKLLQAVDLFCWGVFRKYESDDLTWYNMFKKKIAYDDVFPK